MSVANHTFYVVNYTQITGQYSSIEVNLWSLLTSSLVYLDMQREVYPALLLFPAERKTSVSYEGDMAVADVIKFMAVHGSSSQHLTNEKGN